MFVDAIAVPSQSPETLYLGTATALMLGLCAQGNVRTQTLPAFDRAQFAAIAQAAG